MTVGIQFTDKQARAALALWELGFNTLEIAKAIDHHEAAVHRLIRAAREIRLQAEGRIA